MSRTIRLYCVFLWYIQSRVLLATIKNLGKHPCPRCLILKTDIHNVGTPAGAQQRKRIRVDNTSRRQDVEKARKAMFEKGCKITSTQVQSYLSDRSMVPTRVHIYSLVLHPINTLNRTHSLKDCQGRTTTTSLSSISCMNLRSASGSQYSRI